MAFKLGTFAALVFMALNLHGGETESVLSATYKVTQTKNLAYVEGEKADPKQHRLDLYLPKGDGPWPMLMWIHGGAWAVGHRRSEEPLARRFAERGIAVAAIDHRMSKAIWMNPKLNKGIEHPAHVQDCAAAFAWLVAQADTYKLDPKKMFVGGFSSGAHLSALLAMDPSYLKAHQLELTAIRGAIPVGGAYDIAAYYQSHIKANGQKMADQHVLDVFGHDVSQLSKASPTSFLNSAKVPMLVLSESNTFKYTEVFRKAAVKAKAKHIQFRHFKNRSHQDICRLMARPQADDARIVMEDFMSALIRAPIK